MKFLRVGIAFALSLVSAGTVSAQEAPRTTVDISQFQFMPKDLVVPAGSTVTWINKDVVAHSVTADDQAFNSGLFSSGGEFSLTFDTPGTFGYYCIPHGAPGTGMVGTIVVTGGAATAPLEDGALPPDEVPAED